MFIAADSLDDLLQRVTTKVLKKGHPAGGTQGPNTELFGVLMQLNKPRARLSRTEKRRTLFSCLGEFLWYMAKTNELRFISYYAPEYERESDDNETVRTGYGPRLFRNGGQDQINNVIATLRQKPDSRRAVAQIFQADDGLAEQKRAPCTCTLQFAIRANKLQMMTFMRSNDIYLGLPHDVFAFTMLQEVVARALGVGLGKYRHAVGSLHLYDRNVNDARKMLKEGWQESIPMPPMPAGDPWPSLQKLLYVEAQLREGQPTDIDSLGLDPYWRDLAHLLHIYRLFQDKRNPEIEQARRLLTTRIYDPYVDKKRRTIARPRNPPEPRQQSLFPKAF